NGDGKLDVLLSAAGSASMTLLPGKGDGGFAAAVPIALPSVPAAVLTADLDGDKLPDLTAAIAGQAILFPNDATGSYALARSPSTGAAGQPRNPALADLNGDGKLDVIVAAAKGVSVSLGVG